MYEIISPQSNFLKKHIVSIDVLQKFEAESLKYFAFPQKGTTIAFLKNADIQIKNNDVIISRSEEENSKALFLGKYLNPVALTYNDFVDEVSINFTETGINYYYSEYASTEMQIIELSEIDLDPQRIFIENVPDRIDFLEHYLLKIYFS